MKRVQIMMVLLGSLLLLIGLILNRSVGLPFLAVGLALMLIGVIKETAKK
nr:hypothetical protein [Mammaliicoccus sp. Marseille-Q6498]